jgi:hypothetical protein
MREKTEGDSEWRERRMRERRKRKEGKDGKWHFKNADEISGRR